MQSSWSVLSQRTRVGTFWEEMLSPLQCNFKEQRGGRATFFQGKMTIQLPHDHKAFLSDLK